MTIVKAKNRSQNERRTKTDLAPSTTTRVILLKTPSLKSLRPPRTGRHSNRHASRRASSRASRRHQVLSIRSKRRYHHLLLPRKRRHRQRPHPLRRKGCLLLLRRPQKCPPPRRTNRSPLRRKSRLHLPQKFRPLRRANRLPQLDQPPRVPRVPTLG